MSELPQSLEANLREALQRHELSEYYDDIRPHARLSFRMHVVLADEPPLGASRLGGTPDLPPGLEWSRNPEDGKLMDFIGQINLAQVPKFGQPLPQSGLLLIFSSQEDADENPHEIQFTDVADEATLVRAATPTAEMLSDENSDEPFGSLLITELVPIVSLPDSSTFADYDDDFQGRYYDLVEELYDDPDQKEPTSRLLGYPHVPTGGELPNEHWELLVQIEAHFSGGECYMNFWDAGSLQLIVKRAELPTCRFTDSSVGIFSM